MTRPWTTPLQDLVQTLHELRQRWRHTARREVAQAISAALRETTLTWLGCAEPRPAANRQAYSPWDDPWPEPDDDPWAAPTPTTQSLVEEEDSDGAAATWPPALLAGWGAVRWGYGRTGRVGLAVLLGLLVALAAQVGPPTLQAVLTAWGTATDLLGYRGSQPNH